VEPAWLSISAPSVVDGPEIPSPHQYLLWPDADEQTRNILNEGLTRLRQGDSKLRALETP